MDTNTNQLITSSKWTDFRDASAIALIAGFIICIMEIPVNYNRSMNKSCTPTPYRTLFNNHILPLGSIAVIGGCYGLSVCWLNYSLNCL